MATQGGRDEVGETLPVGNHPDRHDVGLATSRAQRGFVRCKPLLARHAPEHDIDPGQDGGKACPRDLSDAALQELSMEGYDLGDVCDRRLGETGLPRRQQDVAGCARPFDLGCERHADDCGQSASVQSIALDDEHGAPETGS